MDVENGLTAENANIQIYGSNNTVAQKFLITAVSDDYYKIVSKKSGKVLDVANGSLVSGINVRQHTWNGSNAQLWRFIDAGSGQYYIQSKLRTVLEVAGGNGISKANVQAGTLQKTPAQKWVLCEGDSIMETTTVTKD